MPKVELSIFDYLDYKMYLKDLFDEKKRVLPYFSHRSFARSLGLAAPGHILFVMQGKRRLTKAVADRLTTILKFSQKEANYLSWLISLIDASTAGERQFALENLMRLRVGNVSTNDKIEQTFYEKWYYSAICAMVDIIPFKDNYRDLARNLNPSISVPEAKGAIKLLTSLKLISADSQGFYHPTDAILSTGLNKNSPLVVNLKRQFLLLGIKSFENSDSEQQDLSNLTLSVSAETFNDIKRKFAQVRKEILEMARSDTNPDRVLQCNIHLYPLYVNNFDSKKKEKND